MRNASYSDFRHKNTRRFGEFVNDHAIDATESSGNLKKELEYADHFVHSFFSFGAQI
jgi:hypothetical protein